jgi:hypothetical protein
MTRPDARIVHGHSPRSGQRRQSPRAGRGRRRRLTRLPPGRYAASQSVAARRHSPASRQEGHPGRHQDSSPRTPAAPVSTLRTLPTDPSLATPTPRTETTGRPRPGRLVLGVASRHAPCTARPLYCTRCCKSHAHRATGPWRVATTPSHPSRRPGRRQDDARASRSAPCRPHGSPTCGHSSPMTGNPRQRSHARPGCRTDHAIQHAEPGHDRNRTYPVFLASRKMTLGQFESPNRKICGDHD